MPVHVGHQDVPVPEPEQIHNSEDQRLRALAHLGEAGADLADGDALGTAGHISYATSILLELVKLDFEVATGFTEMPEDAWKAAMISFYQARVDHYVDKATGQTKFEPHNDDGQPGASTYERSSRECPDPLPPARPGVDPATPGFSARR
ncbi:MAG TPA: hypothetical protein VF054_11290 [Micromonosporaceae bacterium]